MSVASNSASFYTSSCLKAVVSSPHDPVDIPKINLLHYLMDDFTRFSKRVALVCDKYVACLKLIEIIFLAMFSYRLTVSLGKNGLMLSSKTP